MSEGSIDIKRLKAKHSDKELNDMFVDINNKLDTNHLPKLVRHLKLSRWNEFIAELDEVSKTVEPLHALKLARHTDELTRLTESAIENMFFDVKEIKGAYCKFLQDIRVVKVQMAESSSITPNFSVVDEQLKELEGAGQIDISETRGRPLNEQDTTTTNPAPKITLETNSAPKNSQCCTGCTIF